MPARGSTRDETEVGSRHVEIQSSIALVRGITRHSSFPFVVCILECSSVADKVKFFGESRHGGVQ